MAGPGAAEAELPATVAAAWGVRERSQKGPKPGLSLARIVDAGVRVADSEGLDAVSMGRVAASLDTAPMSLYRHVSSKEELVRLMVDAAWGDSPGPAAARRGLARRTVPLGLGFPGRPAAAPLGGAHPDQRAADHATRDRLVRGRAGLPGRNRPHRGAEGLGDHAAVGLRAEPGRHRGRHHGRGGGVRTGRRRVDGVVPAHARAAGRPAAVPRAHRVHRGRRVRNRRQPGRRVHLRPRPHPGRSRGAHRGVTRVRGGGGRR